MNSKKKIFCLFALLLVLPFFLMIVLFITTAKYEGKVAVDEDDTIPITVKDGKLQQTGHAILMNLPEGNYNFDISWEIEDPGFITAFVLRDGNGEKISAFTAYQTENLKNTIAVPGGDLIASFLFFSSEDALREFAKDCMGYADGPALDQYVEFVGLSSPLQDGDKSFHLQMIVRESTYAPFSLQLATVAVGVILLILLILCITKEPEEEPSLKKRVDHVGQSFGILAISVMLTQILVAVIARQFFADYLKNNAITFSLLLTILSFDVVGFASILLTRGNVSPQKIEEKNLGIGKFLLFVLMGCGIMIPGSFIGNTVHTLITMPFGGAQSNISVLMMNSEIWIRVLALGICAPIVEELIFRKFLIDRLIKYGEFLAIITSALAFGLFHGNFAQFFYAFGLGLLWAFVYVRTGRVRYSMGMHMVINMSSSIITIVLYNRYTQYFPAGITDKKQLMEIAMSSSEAMSAMILYSIWMIILYSAALVGAIVLITLLAKKRFRLKRFEGEPTKSEAMRALFGSKFFWVFFLATIGMFLMSYLPVMLR